MLLTVRDVADFFKVPEETVYRWVAEGGLPAQQVKRQFRFSRTELLEWATRNDIEVSPALVAAPKEHGAAAPPPLAAALAAGGIYYRVPGADRRAALAAMVERLPLPEDVDRAGLVEVLVAREELASTGIGDGIAIPHVRTPIVLNVATAMVSLCFLEEPIEFGALDGKPVRCLFTLVSPNVRLHLQLLSKLAFALRAPDFRAALAREASSAELLLEAQKAEAGVGAAGAPSSSA